MTSDPDLVNNLWLSSFRDDNCTTKLAQFIYNFNWNSLFVYSFLIVLQKMSDPCVVIFDPKQLSYLLIYCI